MNIPALFGTDGVRDKVGTGIFVPEGLYRLGNALGQWALQKYGHQFKVLMINDTRISCDWVKTILNSGLLMHSLSVTDGGVLPTPAAMHLLTDFDCAIIISASHNPWHDNGIKIMDRIHGKLSQEDELILSSLFHSLQENKTQEFGILSVKHELADIYCKKIISFFKPRMLEGKKIVLDVAHGATSIVAPFIFKHLGAELITLHDKPTGFNINDACGSLHPESLIKEVLHQQADIGFAFDGDGDRVLAVNKDGHIKDGDDILALLSQHPAYNHEKKLFGTIMSNEGLSSFLTKCGKTLLRTAVGDKYLLQAMKSHHALLGAEPSGHIILRDLIATGDGILTALRILETIDFRDNQDFYTFDKFPQVLINIPTSKKPNLSESPFKEIIDSVQCFIEGRVLVRFSGTEPLLRIMVEASSHEIAFQAAYGLGEQLKKEIERSS